ncbi:hypothetical protein BsWGS_03455 [Bradybaena similaris]
MRKVNILVFGDTFVGKSAIITQLTQEKFLDEYLPTVHNEVPFVLEYDQNNLELLICDTSGNPDFAKLREEKYHSVEGFVAVYSIISKESVEKLIPMIEVLKVLKAETIPLILVGCKLDMEAERQVHTEQGEVLARLLDCPFAEVSAKERDQVVAVFTRLMKEIDTKSPQQRAASSKCKTKQRKKCCVVL